MKPLQIIVSLLVGIAIGVFVFSSDKERRDPSPQLSKPLEIRKQAHPNRPKIPEIQNLAEALAEPLSFQRQAQLTQLISNLQFDELPGVFQALQFDQTTHNTHEASALIIKRWFESSPDNVFNFLNSMRPSAFRSDAYVHLFKEWAHSEPERGLQQASQITSRHDRYDAYNTILSVYSRKDPSQAFALYQHSKQLTDQTLNIRPLFFYWANKTPKDALAAALTIVSPPEREAALATVIGQWIQNDLEAATREVTGLKSSRSVDFLLLQITEELSGKDPRLAEEWIYKYTEGAQRINALSTYYFSLIEKDPVAASATISALPEGEIKDQAITQLADRWSNEDPYQAFQWLETISSDEQMIDLYQHMMYNFAENDPFAAGQVLEFMPDTDLKRDLINTVSRNYANSDIQEALQWAENFDSTNHSGRAPLQNVVETWSETDPQAAMNYALKSPELSQNSEMLYGIANIMAQSNPGEAAGLLNAIPDPSIRQEMAADIAREWFRTDGEAAHDWLEQLPNGPERTQAIKGLIDQVSPSDPEYAFRWASSIENEEARRESITEAVSVWASTDYEAAAKALSDSGLDEAETQQIIENVNTSLGTQEEPFYLIIPERSY